MQDAGNRRSGLAHAGHVRLGECILHLGPPVRAVGILHVEVPAQGRR